MSLGSQGQVSNLTASKNIRFGVRVVDPQTRQGRIGEIYSQSLRDLLAIPEPLTVHSAAPDVLAGVWAILRETLLAGKVPRGAKEAVATAISFLNRCPWCVDVHSMGLYAAHEGRTVKAILHPEYASAVDPNRKNLIRWATASLSPNSTILQNPPFSPDESAEIIGTAVTFHYLNRIVNALLVTSPLPASNWIKVPMQRTLGFLMSRVMKQNEPGASLVFLPEASLPADFVWASKSPWVAGAFSRFAFVMTHIEKKLDPNVRALIRDHIAAWNGEDPGLSRQWVEDSLDGLSPSQKASARLALYCARAPWHIDESLIVEFRWEYDSEGALIELLAWSAFTSARRISTWLSAF